MMLWRRDQRWLCLLGFADVDGIAQADDAVGTSKTQMDTHHRAVQSVGSKLRIGYLSVSVVEKRKFAIILNSSNTAYYIVSRKTHFLSVLSGSILGFFLPVSGRRS